MYPLHRPVSARMLSQRLRTFFTSALIGSSALLATITPASAQIYGQEHYYIIARHSGKCLDVQMGSLAIGERVVQWTCKGSANQQFQIYPLGGLDAGYYKIFARHSGYALDVAGASTLNGAAVNQYTPHAGYNQQWRIVPTGDGFYRFIARSPRSQVLDIYGVSQADGAPLQIWDNLNGLNQQFELRQVKADAPGACTALPSEASLVGEPSYWRSFINTPGEVIDVQQRSAGGTFPADFLVIKLQQPTSTWFKAIEVLDADNRVMGSVSTWDDIRTSTATIRIRDAAEHRPMKNPATMKLKFYKAGFTGGHVHAYTVCGLAGKDGKSLTFNWVRD